MRIDKLLIVLTFSLTVFGVFMVANASSVLAETNFGDKFFFLRAQVFAAGAGFLAFLVAALLPTRFWQRVSPLLFWGNVLLLAAVLIPGVGVEALGARRWLNISGFTFQPSELAKLTFILYLSSIFAKRKKQTLPFLVVTGIVIGLIVAQPDLGTAAVILATSLSIFFLSGAPLTFFLIFLPAAVISGFFLILVSPYRRERILTFLDPGRDPLSSSYHIKQVILALSTGGLLGVGLGQSRAKYLFLPEAAGDSIFAVIAEELGFLGGAFVIFLFSVIVWRLIRIAAQSNDIFGKLVVSGIATWLGIQTFVNIAAMTATLPITGVPLPFISYGGTALVTALWSIGIVVGISKNS